MRLLGGKAIEYWPRRLPAMPIRQNMSQHDLFDVDLACHWLLGRGETRLDESRLLDTLARIARSGSIAEAARETGNSYRNVWGVLAQWEQRLGHALLAPARGRGTRLTPFAEQLIKTDTRIRENLAPHLAEAVAEMRQALAGAIEPEPATLRIHASHDLALAKLCEMLAGGNALDIRYLGSLESLTSFAEGRCEIAGFHCPEGPVGETLWRQYRPFLKPRQHALIHLVRRTQGMIVAAGNPKKLRGIRDITKRGVHFLNRQSGAGTRLLLDWLLRENGIATKAVAGYGEVELTHSAVAAMIASGHADVGLGVETVARQFGLDFIPLLRENYFLLTRRSLLQQPGVGAVLALARGDAFRRAVDALAGYDASQSGEEIPAP